MAEELNHEEFVRQAIVSLRKSGCTEIHNPDSVVKKMGLV